MNSELITGSIQLTHPEWLWFMLVLLLATLLFRIVAPHNQSASVLNGTSNYRKLFIHPLISLLPRAHSIQKISNIYKIFSFLIFISLILSLAEPVRIGEKRPDPPAERDIVFIVDTSVSMNLRDYVFDNQRIDRMTMLKGVLDRFIQKLAGDRLSIIVFGESAYTLVPLTRDQGLLRRLLARIQTTMAGRFNSVGEAISLAVKQAQPSLNASHSPRHRIIVLLTDADGSTGDIKPEVAAELALQANIPLYSVAIGAPSEEAEESRLTGLIYEPVNYALLSAISVRTGARTYQAGDTNALEKAISDINQHETNQRKLAPKYYRQALYLWPLLFALGLLVGLFLWPIIKSVNMKLLAKSNPKNDAGDISA